MHVTYDDAEASTDAAPAKIGTWCEQSRGRLVKLASRSWHLRPSNLRPGFAACRRFSAIISSAPIACSRRFAPAATRKFGRRSTTATHRYVAIKILLPEYRRDAEQLRTMRHEFEVGRQLQHPRLPRRFELRRVVAGPASADGAVSRRQSSRRAEDRARRSFASSCRRSFGKRPKGSRISTRMGYVHLDVKPDNFMLNDAGEVRLIDFALVATNSRTLGNASSGSNDNERFKARAAICRPNKFVASRSTFAPTSTRSAARCFTSPTGHTAVHGLDERRIADEASARCRRRTCAPTRPTPTPEFAELVRRMMAKRPEDRPHSVGELLPRTRRDAVLEVGRRPQADANDVGREDGKCGLNVSAGAIK